MTGNNKIRKKSDSLRERAETRISREPEIMGDDPGSLTKLVNELHVHQIELQLQNEELISTKEQLELALQKYDDFYDFAPIAYFSFNKEGRILEVNLTGTTLLNMPRSKLIGMDFQRFILNEGSPAFMSMLKNVFHEGTGASCEVTLSTGKEEEIHVHIQCSKPIAEIKCLAVMSDITEVIRMEEAKRLSDDKFRIISTHSPDHIIMQDRELRYTWVVNPQFGLTENEMIGKTDFDLINYTDAQFLCGIKKRVLDTGKNEFHSFPLKDPSGNNNYFEGTYIPLFSKKGETNGLVGYFRNITERVKMEHELTRIRDYLEQLINYANAPIIVWNPSSEIIIFNKAFERLTGYTAKEVIGERLDFLFPLQTLKNSKDKIRQTLEGDFWDSIEIPIQCKSGEIKIVLWNSSNIYDPETKSLNSTIAQGNDITSRKKMETALEVAGQKLNLALDTGNIGIWEYDLSSHILEFDERLKRIAGMTGTPPGDNLKTFENVLHEEDVKYVKEAFRKTIETGDPLDTLFRLRLPNGMYKYLIFKGNIFKLEGLSPRITGVCIDITGLKKETEKSLFKLNEELSRSNKELEQFAYITSHDLQEPLRMVSSFTQMLSLRYGDKLDDTAREYIRFAVEGSQRMYDLINGLLDYSRVSTKGSIFEKVDLNHVMNIVVRNLEIMIEKNDARVIFSPLPEVFADKNQMSRLFQNLISNGIKFNTCKPVIEVTSADLPEAYLFSVKDNGIGIYPEYFERIFKIFQRLHTKDQYEGTGIGLSVCKRIVERHGGKIWVESVPGKGSVFHFTIRKEAGGWNRK